MERWAGSKLGGEGATGGLSPRNWWPGVGHGPIAAPTAQVQTRRETITSLSPEAWTLLGSLGGLLALTAATPIFGGGWGVRGRENSGRGQGSWR